MQLQLMRGLYLKANYPTAFFYTIALQWAKDDENTHINE